MKLFQSSRCLAILCCGLVLGSAGSCSSQAAHAPARPAGPPATVAEAAKVLDLATFPLMDGAEKPARRLVARLSYKVPANAQAALEFQRQQFASRNWQELPGSYLSDQMSSGTFAKDGFAVAVMTYPTGVSGQVSVAIDNFGNVALDKLPVPADAKPLVTSPATAMFLTEAPVAQTAEACTKLLTDNGWRPYGQAGNSRIFKQNAIMLNANIAAAPAQGGKTMITYSTRLMSADLPAPTDTINLQYADSTTQLLFDTKASMKEVFDFYRQTLANSGWAATLDTAVKINDKDTVIFRNPQKEMITAAIYDVNGTNRVILDYLSTAEFEKLYEDAKPAADKSKPADKKSKSADDRAKPSAEKK